MKRILLAVFITAVVTSACWYVLGGLRRGAEGLWLMSAVKAPGRMALHQIQHDFAEGHIEAAKAEVDALRRQWDVFESEAGFRGEAIGNIMVMFSQLKLPQGSSTNTEPDGSANRSQPVGPGTNRTPPAAGSGG